MAGNETWTAGRLLQWTSGYLKDHGSDSSRLDAELLLSEAWGCKRIELYTRFAEEPAEPIRKKFRELVQRRAKGAPVAYLLGRREFYSLDFAVSPDVLIPRPETEFVVVAVVDLLKEQAGEGPVAVADVGTGSGAIAVSIAKHEPRAHLTAIDISAAALTVARKNAETHRLLDRIEFVESDLFAGVPAEARFTIVASNPPYITSDEMKTLPRDVGEHEPRLALDGGPQGTDVIARLIPQAAERLLPGGHLLMEISPMIEPAVRQLVEADGRFEVRPTVKDLGARPRVVVARRR